MKSLAQINDRLHEFEKQFGMQVVGAQQGSVTWMQIKLGVISASNASKAVAKLDSETRATYMAELVAQIATGIFPEVNAPAMEWGHFNEDAARSSYEFSRDVTITQLPFVFKDGSYREGCSPDGIVDDFKGVEIKCPFNSVQYIKFLCEEKIKSEWQWQYQYIMRVMEADSWDFCQYDPRMKKQPLKILTVKRDEEYQKKFDDLIPGFISDMDAMLKKIGIEFGTQWSRLAEKD